MEVAKYVALSLLKSLTSFENVVYTCLVMRQIRFRIHKMKKLFNLQLHFEEGRWENHEEDDYGYMNTEAGETLSPKIGSCHWAI